MNARSISWVVISTLLWAAVGSAVTWWLVSGSAAVPAAEAVAERTLERAAELQLSPEQMDRLEQILAQYQEVVLREENSFWERVDEASRGADAEIEAMLTESQRDRYLQLISGRKSS